VRGRQPKEDIATASRCRLTVKTVKTVKMQNNVPGVNAGVSKMKRVTTFLHVVFRPKEDL